MGGRPGSGAQQNINFYKRDIQTGAETSCASGYNTLYITITVFFISCTDRNHGSYKTGTESGSSYVKAVPDLWNCISDLLRDIQSAVQTYLPQILFFFYRQPVYNDVPAVNRL